MLQDTPIAAYAATRDGREKRFIALPCEHWRFLLTWSPDGPAEFPHWVPWAVLFTLIRRFHDLTAAPAFMGYSADLQSIELNRALTPLLTRLSGEGYRPQDFAGPVFGRTAEEVALRFQSLLPGFAE